MIEMLLAVYQWRWTRLGIPCQACVWLDADLHLGLLVGLRAGLTALALSSDCRKVTLLAYTRWPLKTHTYIIIAPQHSTMLFSVHCIEDEVSWPRSNFEVHVSPQVGEVWRCMA